MVSRGDHRMSAAAFCRNDASAADALARAENYIPTTLPRPHPPRRRAILAAHPEVATLIGQDRRTAAITLCVVLGQTAIAAVFGYLGFAYWWAALLMAICIGAF